MKLNYIAIPLIMIITSVAGGIFTNLGMDWYNNLIKPPLTPPGQIIGTIWTVIFILATTSALIFWNNFPRNKKFQLIFIFFIANAVLNAGWSLLFFTFNLVFLSIFEMILLNITTVILTILIWSKSRLAASLLIPYIIWVFLATFLAYGVFLLNPQF